MSSGFSGGSGGGGGLARGNSFQMPQNWGSSSFGGGGGYAAPPGAGGGSYFHGDNRELMGNGGLNHINPPQFGPGAQPPPAIPPSFQTGQPPAVGGGANPYVGMNAQQIMAKQNEMRMAERTKQFAGMPTAAQNLQGQAGRAMEGLAHPYYAKQAGLIGGNQYNQARTGFLQGNPGYTFDLAEQIRRGQGF